MEGHAMLDRAYQRELLQMLAAAYPQGCDVSELLRGFDEAADRRYLANMVYLEEHGLIDAQISFGMDGHASQGRPRINNRGMDFLADDGGLSAILGVVTIKLHDEDLRALIASRLDQSSLAPADKKRFLDQLRSLPADAIKQVVLELLKQGLAHGPDVLHTIGRLMGVGA
jgi:hypothetical protein